MRKKRVQKKVKKNSIYCFECGKMIGYNHFYCKNCEPLIPETQKIEDIVGEYISKQRKIKKLERIQLECVIRKILENGNCSKKIRTRFYSPLEIRSNVYKKIEVGLARMNIMKTVQAHQQHLL